MENTVVLHEPGATFACMNGGAGFVSFFDGILSPYRFVVAIKGGPGTGKSGLMRKIAERRQEAGETVKRILCSSDPRSLDGVLLPERGVAIVDATSPHAREPSMPGASGWIVNTLDHADTAALFERRGEIISLSRIKGAGYERAYRMLAAAGEVFKVRLDAMKETLDGARLSRLTRRIGRLAGKDRGTARTVIPCKAFCSMGNVRLDAPESEAQTVVTVMPFCGGERLLLDALSRAFPFEVSPDPISGLPDSLFDRRTGLLVRCGNAVPVSEEHTVDSKRFFGTDGKAPDALKESVRIENELAKGAVSWFREASRAHFALEEIYKEAMDFDALGATLEKIEKTVFAVSSRE